MVGACQKRGESFNAIARRPKVAHTTVLREILKHALPSDNGAKGR